MANNKLGFCYNYTLHLTVWLFLFDYCLHIDAFNLENRLPIVKYGDDGTYFGYSVASHITVKDADGKDEAETVKW